MCVGGWSKGPDGSFGIQVNITTTGREMTQFPPVSLSLTMGCTRISMFFFPIQKIFQDLLLTDFDCPVVKATAPFFSQSSAFKELLKKKYASKDKFAQWVGQKKKKPTYFQKHQAGGSVSKAKFAVVPQEDKEVCVCGGGGREGRASQPIIIGTTRAKPMATPLVVFSDGVEIWVAVGCSNSFFFFFHCFNACSGVRTTHH